MALKLRDIYIKMLVMSEVLKYSDVIKSWGFKLQGPLYYNVPSFMMRSDHSQNPNILIGICRKLYCLPPPQANQCQHCHGNQRQGVEGRALPGIPHPAGRSTTPGAATGGAAVLPVRKHCLPHPRYITADDVSQISHRASW